MLTIIMSSATEGVGNIKRCCSPFVCTFVHYRKCDAVSQTHRSLWPYWPPWLSAILPCITAVRGMASVLPDQSTSVTLVQTLEAFFNFFVKLEATSSTVQLSSKDFGLHLCHFLVECTIANRRCPCKTSYVHETKFYRRDKKRSGVVDMHIYLLIFKHMSLNQLLISML